MSNIRISKMLLTEAHSLSGIDVVSNHVLSHDSAMRFVGEEIVIYVDGRNRPGIDDVAQPIFSKSIEDFVNNFKGTCYLVKSGGTPRVMSRIDRYKGLFANAPALKKSVICSTDACVEGARSTSVSIICVTKSICPKAIDEAYLFSEAFILLVKDDVLPEDLLARSSRAIRCKDGWFDRFTLLREFSHLCAFVVCISRSQDLIARIFSTKNDELGVARLRQCIVNSFKNCE